MTFTPTAQQAAAISALPLHRVVRVIACAGSGKTSLLRMMAESAPSHAIYLGFNKAIAMEAAQKFPRHVKCSTTHALAYASLPQGMRERLARPKGAYVNVAGTGAEVGRYLHVQPIHLGEGKQLSQAAIGSLVKDTVAKFEQSADTELSRQHVPFSVVYKVTKDPATVSFVVNNVLGYARKLWAERNSSTSRVLLTHDTYLKMFQLGAPTITYDTIFLDEAQDTTPCVADIVLRQKSRIILVGDPRQAIYGWRGAVNAMAMPEQFCTDPIPSFPLTKSFRYGQVIADVATAILEGSVRLEGNPEIPSVAGMFLEMPFPQTHIYRTNSALLMGAVQALAEGRKVAIATDTADFVRLLESAIALWAQDMRNVKHDKVLPYLDWQELVDDVDDLELQRIAKAVPSGLASRWVDVLQHYKRPETYDILYTTAHKAKGLEWDNVCLAEDFRTPVTAKGWQDLPEEEVNLLYVAATRAKLMLRYNGATHCYVQRAQEHQT